MTSHDPDKTLAPRRSSDRPIRVACGLVASLGVAVLIAWHLHWTVILQGLPGLTTMRYNSAVCFVLSSLGVALFTTRYVRYAIVPATCIGLVAGLTVLEYLIPLPLRIDEIIVKDYFAEATANPGRMSPLSASCFILLSAALFLGAAPARRTWRVALVGALACTTAVIALVALFGYLAGIQVAYGWGAYTRMAIHTAAAILVLSLALLGWAWETARREDFDLLRWLPVAGSLTLMAMVAFVSSVSLAQLKNSVDWRTHTYEVLLEADTLLADLSQTQRGMHRYVLNGQSAGLAAYQDASRDAPQHLARLKALTMDNPFHVRRLRGLDADVADLLAYAQRLLNVRDTQGLAAATRLDAEGTGRDLMDRTRADVQAFSSAERQLLTVRDAAAQENLHNASRLLVLGSVLAAFLLVLAHWLAQREMTRRRRTEAQLRSSEERFRRAFDDAPSGMALVSPAGRFLKVNHALCEMLGYKDTELLDADFRTLTHPEDLPKNLELMEKVLSGKIPSYQVEKRYFHRDGSLVFATLNVSLARDHSGSPSYFISQLLDITQRRHVDQMKREFISTVSHELRTPLTSIRGSLGLLEGGVLGKLPEKAEALVKIAYQNSERLVRIINDILDIEKIESGKLELHLQPVALPGLLRQALEVNQAYGERYQVRFVLESTPADTGVMADPDRLMQVMANLLSNAAKFSPPGGEVRARAFIRGAMVCVEVEDRGPGIPESFRSRIFEKFAQADGSSSRRFEGTGLGLAITRQLVQAMHGTIGFRSTVGEGTVFHLELPRQSASVTVLPTLSDTGRYRVLVYQKPPGESSVPGGPPRILHVEDDLDLSRVIEAALAGQVEVVTAPTLHAAEQLLSETPFSLVVLDLSLPDGNGLHLLERVPKIGGRSAPVVILSGTEVSHEVRQRVAAALVKSRVSEAHIVQTILSLVPRVPALA